LSNPERNERKNSPFDKNTEKSGSGDKNNCSIIGLKYWYKYAKIPTEGMYNRRKML
jgi:hypothetical protein